MRALTIARCARLFVADFVVCSTGLYGFDPTIGAFYMLLMIRYQLQQYPDAFDRITICVFDPDDKENKKPADFLTYERLMPLVFPTSDADRELIKKESERA
jgi:hypothetical protein